MYVSCCGNAFSSIAVCYCALVARPGGGFCLLPKDWWPVHVLKFGYFRMLASQVCCLNMRYSAVVFPQRASISLLRTKCFAGFATRTRRITMVPCAEGSTSYQDHAGRKIFLPVRKPVCQKAQVDSTRWSIFPSFLRSDLRENWFYAYRKRGGGAPTLCRRY